MFFVNRDNIKISKNKVVMTLELYKQIQDDGIIYVGPIIIYKKLFQPNLVFTHPGYSKSLVIAIRPDTVRVVTKAKVD